jgi:hypothetical protein
MNRIAVSTLTIVLLFGQVVNAQTIRGTITDPLTGKGIPNLTVTLADCTTVTDSLGHYVIRLGVTSVGEKDEDKNSRLPKAFQLFQNYPNPFNAETIIKYDLPRRSKVKMKIYNLFGQEITTLLVEEKEAGSYQIRWEGKDNLGRPVASGIYLIRFEAEEFVKVRKMVVIR